MGSKEKVLLDKYLPAWRRNTFRAIRHVRSRLAHTTPLQDFNTALNLMERKWRKPTVRSYPPMIQVEVTTRCNLRCRMCSPRKGMELKDLSEELVPTLVSLSSHVPEMELFGFGEPLVADVFYRLIAELNCGRISFFTNGKLLDKKLFEELLASSRRPLSSITFSIDGAKASTHEKVRQGSRFDSVMANLEDLKLFKKSKRLRYPSFHLSFVAQRSNIEELPDLVRLAKEKGLSKIIVSHAVIYNPLFEKESLLFSPDLTREIFRETELLGDVEGIEIDLPAVLHSKTMEKTPSLSLPVCDSPWCRPYISVEGEVSACCFAPQLVMGRIGAVESFEKIWNGRAFVEFRKKVNTSPPAACLSCEKRFRFSETVDHGSIFLRGYSRGIDP